MGCGKGASVRKAEAWSWACESPVTCFDWRNVSNGAQLCERGRVGSCELWLTRGARRASVRPPVGHRRRGGQLEAGRHVEIKLPRLPRGDTTASDAGWMDGRGRNKIFTGDCVAAKKKKVTEKRLANDTRRWHLGEMVRCKPTTQRCSTIPAVVVMRGGTPHLFPHVHLRPSERAGGSSDGGSVATRLSVMCLFALQRLWRYARQSAWTRPRACVQSSCFRPPRLHHLNVYHRVGRRWHLGHRHRQHPIAQ